MVIDRQIVNSLIRKSAKSPAIGANPLQLPADTHTLDRQYTRQRRRSLPQDQKDEASSPTIELSSTAREKQLIRETPVINSKYLPVWKRLKAKIKARFFMKDLNRELQLFGASTIAIDSEDLQARVGRIVRKRGSNYFRVDEFGVPKQLPLFVLRPSHWFKSLWNTVLAMLLLYTATIMPFRLAFLEESDVGYWLYLEYTVNALFVVDFIVNCLSAYYDLDGKIVATRKEIMLNYFRGWMIIDLVACIPFALFDSETGQNTTISGSSAIGYNNLLRLIRVPRLYRIFRVSRLFKALKQRNEHGFLARLQDFVSLKHSAMRLISFFLTMLICVHLMSCLWYFTAALQGFSTDCWIYKFGFQDEDIYTAYVVCFYWAFTTLTTVGYGDIYATTSIERIIAVLWMMFGVCFYSFTIGSLTSMITNIDTKETVLNHKLAIIDEFAKESRLRSGLRAKLRRALRYLTEKIGFSWSDKFDIFNELPKKLKYEVAMAMHQGVVRTIPFFDDKNDVFIATVVPFLVPMFAQASTLIYKERDYADEVYFIARGRCSLVLWQDEAFIPVKRIARGAYFGEIEIIQAVPRKYTIEASIDSDLLVMSKGLLEVIFDEFKGTYRQIEEIAETRDILNQRAIKEMRQLLRLKRQSDFAGMSVEQIKEKIKQNTDKFTPEKRSWSKVTTLDSIGTSTEFRSQKSECEVLPQRPSVKEKLAESEKLTRLVKEMLREQNSLLRSSACVRKMVRLPPLSIPQRKAEAVAGSESSSEEIKRKASDSQEASPGDS